MDAITIEQFMAYDHENTVLVDVRTEREFKNGHFEGALNIPVDSIIMLQLCTLKDKLDKARIRGVR